MFKRIHKFIRREDKLRAAVLPVKAHRALETVLVPIISIAALSFTAIMVSHHWTPELSRIWVAVGIGAAGLPVVGMRFTCWFHMRRLMSFRNRRKRMAA